MVKSIGENDRRDRAVEYLFWNTCADKFTRDRRPSRQSARSYWGGRGVVGTGGKVVGAAIGTAGVGLGAGEAASVGVPGGVPVAPGVAPGGMPGGTDSLGGTSGRDCTGLGLGLGLGAAAGAVVLAGALNPSRKRALEK